MNIEWESTKSSAHTRRNHLWALACGIETFCRRLTKKCASFSQRLKPRLKAGPENWRMLGRQESHGDSGTQSDNARCGASIGTARGNRRRLRPSPQTNP